MPTSPCIEPHCPREATKRGRCDEHRKALERDRSRRRRADPERGKRVQLYHRKRWLTTREKILTRDPICRVCDNRLSEEVDHVIPLSQGGAEWDPENLQGICSQCHALKSGREGHPAHGTSVGPPM